MVKVSASLVDMVQNPSFGFVGREGNKPEIRLRWTGCKVVDFSRARVKLPLEYNMYMCIIWKVNHLLLTSSLLRLNSSHLFSGRLRQERFLLQIFDLL
mmetsp:Transcript_13714/g.15636  ORF Transcript_13714/g.15636 Transcript_13714/m.15636 type:complete len:98 (+) Transcript_13714:577-870(+)